MTFQPAPAQAGLWTNPDWQPGDPGTFVVLIGVSAYPFLEGGTAPQRAPENYGLNQLAVSALTTYRLFEWLRKQYLYAPADSSPCQLAQCWLLLSPTPDEKALMAPDVLAHNLEPTYANCVRAMRGWRNSMQQLGNDDQAKQSRAVFFFSGHGLQVSHEEQILLPADYLDPANGGALNDALNMQQACLSLRELSVNNQFIFMDACRNDTPKLREQVIIGNGVFNQALAFRDNSECNQLLMYAAAAGKQTFGPPTVSEGISLFGQSLLSGLKAERNFALNRQGMPYAVEWVPLCRYVKATYNELLLFYKTTLKQNVVAAGNIVDFDAVVTHIIPTSTDGGLGMTESHPKITTSGLKLPAGTSPDALVYETYTDPLVGHDFYGRETVTALWDKARLYALNRQNLAEQPLAQSVQVQKVERTPDLMAYKVKFTMPDVDPGIYWLALSDTQTEYGVVLPFFIHSMLNAHFMVEFSITDHHTATFTIDGLQGGLSTESDYLLSDAARLWEKYEEFGAFKAAEDLDVNTLNQLVRGKVNNPMGALIGSIILMRVGRTDKLPRQWLENLFNWFPEYADTPVLLNEYLLRQPTSPDEDDETRRIAYQKRIEGCLLTMYERGLPVTGEVLSYAIRQASNLLSVSPDIAPNSGKPIDDTYDVLQVARQYFLPGGLFTAFVGQGDKLAGLRSRWYARG